MKNAKYVVLILVLVLVLLTVMNLNKEATPTRIPTNDKTWSESSIFTNEQYQSEQEKEIKQEYNAFDTKYTIDNPYIKVNPYSINPLSAYIIFDSKVPVKYSYVVHSKDELSNFEYQNDEYNKRVVIPVLGLFENANNLVSVTIEDKDERTKSADIQITTGAASYNPVKTKIKTDISNEVRYGWFFDSFYNGFDTNGDIRYNLNAGVEDNPMRFNKTSFYVKVDNYQTIYEMNIMGKIINTYKTPNAEYNFHHDIVKASNGYTYALGSYNVDFENIPYAESLIFKYDNKSKYPVEIFDIHDDFDKNLVSQYGTPNTNDMIHLNSIDYIEESNELIVSSQSQSFIASLDADDGSVVWVIQDDKSNIENKDKNLKVINPDKFEQTSGQHTAFVNENAKYDKYRDKGDIVISIFNNNNCKNDNGKLLWREYEEVPTPEQCSYDTSNVLIYAVNEKQKTVEQIDSFVIDDQYASIMSSVFNTASDDFIVHYNQGSKPKSYLIDNEGNVLIEFKVKGYSGNGYYRTNFKEFAEITKMIDKL